MEEELEDKRHNLMPEAPDHKVWSPAQRRSRAMRSPVLKIHKRRGESFWYYKMLFIPGFIAIGNYLGFLDGFAVAPPRFAVRPYFPTFSELEPKTGVFTPQAFILKVIPWLLYDTLSIIGLGVAWASFGHYFTDLWLAIALLLTLLVLGVLVWRTWMAYWEWACTGLSITTEAIYKLEGIFATSHISVQGDDIRSVRVTFPRPMIFWKWAGIGTLVVEFESGSSTSATTDKFIFAQIASVESIGTLVRGLQREREQADRKQADTSLEMRDELVQLNAKFDTLLSFVARLTDKLAPALSDSDATIPLPTVPFGLEPAPPDALPT